MPVAFLVVACLTLVGCRSGSELVEPAPITQTQLTDEQVREAVIRGMNRRGWIAESDSGTVITASNNVRNKHMIVVQIAYTGGNVEITYHDSDNMAYSENSDGSATIHSNYMNWTNNLRQDILSEISLMRLRQE